MTELLRLGASMALAASVACTSQTHDPVWHRDCNVDVAACVEFRHLARVEMLRHSVCSLFFASLDRRDAFVATFIDWRGGREPVESPIFLTSPIRDGYWSRDGYVISMVGDYDRTDGKWHPHYFPASESESKFARCVMGD